MLLTHVLPLLFVSMMALLLGFVLVIVAKRMAVSSDEKWELVRELLPGVNCGACGYAGCDDYANGIIYDQVPVNLCAPGGDVTARRISRTLGRESTGMIPMTAVVACSGTNMAARRKMDYRGRASCAAASLFYQGDRMCLHSCLGFGDCVPVCPFKAITIVDGLARVNKMLCTGCGKCVPVCPHHVLYLRPHAQIVHVACTNPDSGKLVRSYCSNGCIGCKKCENTCPVGAIKLESHVAWTFPEICIQCEACVNVCPVKAIKSCRPGRGQTTAQGEAPYPNSGAPA